MPRKRSAAPTVLSADPDPNLQAKLVGLFNQLPSLAALPPAQRAALADSLIDPTHYAAAGVPRMPARTQHTTATGQRRLGGGRPPDQTREVLASDVRNALLALGLSAARWHGESGSGLLLEVSGACWQVATGEKMHKDDGSLKDWRRHTDPKRRWYRVLP